MRTSDPAPISADLRELALHPDKHEPLASFVSDVLLKIGEIKGLNIAADVPDDYLSRAAITTGKQTPTSILNMLTSGQFSSARIDGHWLVIADGGHKPHDVYTRRTNRVALAEPVFAASTDTPTIEGALRSTRSQCTRSRMTPSTRALPAPCLGEMIRRYLGIGRHTSSLGALMERYAGAVPSGRVKFSSLDPNTARLLGEMVFGRDPRFNPIQRMVTNFNSRPATYENLCDVLPAGLPPDGYLSVATTNGDAVFSANQYAQAVLPFQIAMNTNRTSGGPGEGFRGLNPTTSDKFRTGRERRVTVRLQFTSDLSSRRMVDETHLTPGDAIPYSQLPDSFRKQVDEELSRLRTGD